MTSHEQSPAMAAYRWLIDSRPDLFPATPPGGITIITETQMLGQPDNGEVGVQYRDEYITLLRDRVEFPDGRPGNYIRVVPSSRASGSAILPVVDGEIVLIRHFRHATRQWHWEIPRGFGDNADDSPETTARRELTEEIGCDEPKLTAIGEVHPDTGLESQSVQLFLARITRLGITQSAEGISAARLVSPSEFEQLLMSGEITDSFAIVAFTAARTRGLL